MRRYSIFVLFAVLLVMSCASVTQASFPTFSFGLSGRGGDGTVNVPLQMGFVFGQEAWYFCTDTNNIKISCQQDLTLVPKLTSLANTIAGPKVYFVTNFDGQKGPAFTDAPLPFGDGTYTGLWTVIYLTWNPGVTPWCISDPTTVGRANGGLPLIPSQATLSNVACAPACPALGFTVIDCPMVAVGTLSNPWKLATTPTTYRIPQGIAVTFGVVKTLEIPYFNVYCQNRTSLKISLRKFLLTDAANVTVAGIFGANIAT